MSSPLPADGRPGRGHDVYRVVGGLPGHVLGRLNWPAGAKRQSVMPRSVKSSSSSAMRLVVTASDDGGKGHLGLYTT